MTPAPLAFDPSSRRPALDGLRGVAILMVILVHCTVIEATSDLERVVLAPLFLGWSGVDLFFVLSGFLITSILLDTRDSVNYFRVFYARRLLRVAPLYYTVLVLTLMVLPQIPHPKHAEFARIEGTEWCYWLFLSNFAMAADNDFLHGILAVTWSLSIEEQFYLLWPLIVLAIGPRGLKWLCPGLVLFSLSCRMILQLGYDYGPVPLYTLTQCRLDGLAVGSWIAALVYGGLQPDRWARVSLWMAVLGYGCLVLSETVQMYLHPNEPYVYSDFAAGPGFTILALAYGALLLLALSDQKAPRLVRAHEHPVLRSFGKYSYGIFLLHGPARAVFRDVVFGPPTGSTLPLIPFVEVGGSYLLCQAIFLPPAILLSWSVGWLSWRIVERPFLRLKRWFVYKSAPETQSALPAPD